VEDGVVFFLDKVEQTTRACDNLLPTWKTHGSPQGDPKVKETMHRMASNILEEIDQWRENSSTDDTLNSLTSIETRGNQGDELRHLERGRGSGNIISFHTEIIDQKDQNSRKQSPDLTVVVRRDDITPTSSAKTRRKTQRGNTRQRRGRVAKGGLGDNHAPGDKRNKAEVLNLNKTPNCDPHVSRDRGYTMDTNGRIR